MPWELRNKNLSKRLHELGLVEDEMGYWFYPPYSSKNWIVVTYDDCIRFINGFALTKDNKINDYGYSAQYKLTEYAFIDRRVKELIREFNQIAREQKSIQVQEKLNNIKKDFE